MNSGYDVVIIGGGLAGSASAYFLAAKALSGAGSVLVVERDPSYQYAPSARSAGGIRQQFSTPENVSMGLFGAEFVHHISEHLSINGEPVNVEFRQSGYLLLATPLMLPTMRRNQAMQLQHGAQIRFLDKATLAARFPALGIESIVGGFLGERNEGWTDSYGLLQAFKRKAQALGVEYATATVTGVQRVGDRITGVVLQDHGVVSAAAVVNAAGASGARAIAESVGVHLPIESRLRTTYLFQCQQANLSDYPLLVLPNGLVCRPEGDGFLCNFAPPPEKDIQTFDFTEADPDYFEQTIWPILAEYVPAFDAVKLTGTYSCHYDFNTLDENLIIGCPPGLSNFYLICGFSGHGMQQSPAVGRAIAELIGYGEYRTLDLTRFGYQRVLTGDGIHEDNCW